MKQAPIKIDQDNADRAIEILKEQTGITLDTRKMIRFLMAEYCKKNLAISVNEDLLEWNATKSTSFTYDEIHLGLIKSKVKDLNINPTNEFIVNLLITNYIKQNEKGNWRNFGKAVRPVR